MSERGVIGVDLGTSNSVMALAAAGPEDAEPAIEIMGVPQITSAGALETLPGLPSFLYIPSEHELADGAIALPWEAQPRVGVGVFARDQGGKVPHRLVSSAKSWLCHDRVDRRAAILPWAKGAEQVPRVSPVLASAKVLHHLRCAFEHHHPGAALADQDVVLTVPASFDPAARDLTVEAARAAGLADVTLLEEPQAALYAWLDAQGERWRDHLTVGDVVLVCDVGGGTTDFSLIAITEQQGSLGLERIAVGDHILLGGDNMDFALAYALKQDMERESKTRLDSWQVTALVQSARAGKEALLTPGGPERWPVVIPNRGARLFKRNLKAELTAERILRVVTEGFFPRCGVEASPRAPRRTGLTQLGLPYAADPAITRHLAAFLRRNRSPESSHALRHPTAVLFNGGVLKAGELVTRVVDALGSWVTDDGGAPPRVLDTASLDLAVARGAAYYGRARQGRGVRIRGGTARAYYVGVEQPMPAVPGFEPPLMAVCVAPLGMEEGSHVALPGERLGLVVGEAARFRFFGSRRKDDVAGTVIEDIDPDVLSELPEIEVALPTGEGQAAGSLVEVGLEASVTSIGTLALHCVEAAPGEGRWKLEFGVRGDPDLEPPNESEPFESDDFEEPTAPGLD